MERQWYDRSPYVNQSLFNPEWVYGVRASLWVRSRTFANAPTDDVAHCTEGQQGPDLASLQCASLRRTSEGITHADRHTDVVHRSSTAISTSTSVAGTAAHVLPPSIPTAALCTCSQASTTGRTPPRWHRTLQTRFLAPNTRPCQVWVISQRLRTQRRSCRISSKPLTTFRRSEARA